MKTYLTQSVRILSLLLGTVSYIISWPIISLYGVDMSWAWAIITGAAVAIISALSIALRLRISDSRYHGVEAEIGEPVHMTVNANVSVDEITRNGYLYLTSDRLIGYFRDRKPYKVITFAKDRVSSVREMSPIAMQISVYTHMFELVSSESENLAETMRKLGWSVGVAELSDQ